MEQTRYYTKKFCKWSELAVLISVLVMIALTQPIGMVAGMSREALTLMWQINLSIALVEGRFVDAGLYAAQRHACGG